MVDNLERQRLSGNDMKLEVTQLRGIEDILAGRTTTGDAIAVQTKAEMGGRSVEDLVKAYKSHKTLGAIFASVVGGYQDKLTEDIAKAETPEQVGAIQWALTVEEAMTKAQEALAKVTG